MGEGHTYSNYSVTAARPPTLKYWLQISGRTAETNIRIIRQKYTVFRHRCEEVSGNGSDVVISPVKTCNIFNLRVLLTERIEFWVKSWLTWNLIKTSSERPTSKSRAATVCRYLILGSLIVCYSAALVKILKVISRVSYYCSMGPGRSSEPKQQCWPESPLKTNLNSLWHRGRLFIPQIEALLLRAAWTSRAPYFIYSPWINNADSDSTTRAEVCQDVSMSVCARRC